MGNSLCCPPLSCLLSHPPPSSACESYFFPISLSFSFLFIFYSLFHISLSIYNFHFIWNILFFSIVSLSRCTFLFMNAVSLIFPAHSFSLSHSLFLSPRLIMFPWHLYLILTGQTTIEYYFYQAMHNVGNTTVNVVRVHVRKSEIVCIYLCMRERKCVCACMCMR